MSGSESSSDINNHERQLVFEVAEGLQQGIFLIGRFRMLCEQAQGLPYILCLQWLTRQRITGQRFLDFYEDEHKGSLIQMAAHMRKGVYRDYQLRKIIAN